MIPFASIVVAAVSTAVAKAFPTANWIKYGGWLCAAALIVLWVVLDLANFKELSKRKGTKYGASSGLTILLAIAVITGIAVVTSRPRFDKSIDLTKSKANTLAEQ
jgi:fucose 4-O-acetylase-like acetyltransferase